MKKNLERISGMREKEKDVMSTTVVAVFRCFTRFEKIALFGRVFEIQTTSQ